MLSSACFHSEKLYLTEVRRIPNAVTQRVTADQRAALYGIKEEELM
jgi:hypothetical protein